MPSQYLQGGDLVAYGVPSATTQQVQRASTVVDAYLQRPEGLSWTPDSAGSPAYMTALTPKWSLTSAGAIAPGQNVAVTVSGPVQMADIIGEALVLDRANTGATEVCVIASMLGSTITLASVANAHSSGCVMDAGMSILEQRTLPAKRSIMQVTRDPVARILSGQGQYAYGRRSDQVAGLYYDTNLLATIQTFGGPPLWNPFDVTQCSVSTDTGEVWVPAGLMLAYYSDVRLRYLAGYPVSGIPSVVKQATANIVQKLIEFGDADPSFKVIKAGGTTLERFRESAIDIETQALLQPFMIKLFF